MGKLTVKILLEEQLRNKYATLTFLPGNGATPQQYLKWISYVPDDWNITEILKKKPLDLTEDELSKINQIKMESEIKPFFENFVSNDPTTSISAYKVYEYMSAINLHTYAEMKLSNEEKEYCNSQLELSTEKEIREKITLLENSESIADDYLVFLLKRKLANICDTKEKQKLKSEIARNNVPLKSII